MNLFSFAGNSLRGWAWCQILVHVIKRWKYRMVTVRRLPSVLPPCPPTPPAHEASPIRPPTPPTHSRLVLPVSPGSFQSSFMRIQADMMLFFLFSFAHRCMANTLVWTLLFPNRVAMMKSCVRSCVSSTSLRALKMLSWFYQIANIVVGFFGVFFAYFF